MKVQNFIIGIGSILESASSFFDFGVNKNTAFISSDYEAIKNDWEQVGKDLKGAIDSYGSKVQKY